jgi:CRP/FNR family transcriptional regulator, cyclic AMP receptor protein
MKPVRSPRARRAHHQKETTVKRDPKLDRLAAQPLLRGLPDRDLKEIAKVADTVHLTAGHRLMTEGARGTETLLIEDGEVSVIIDDVEVSRLGPGQVVGEMALLDRQPRSATAVALTDVTALVFSAQAFMSLADRPLIGARLASTLASRLRAVENAP